MRRKEKGLVYVFTGEGKGKTSAALGMAVRAVCAGKKAAWVSWYKDDSWPISERELSKRLPIKMSFLGKGFYIFKKTKFIKRNSKVVDKASKIEHRKAALLALKKAKVFLKSKKCDLLVCDEINSTVKDKLLTVKRINELLRLRGKTHLILTGRDVPREIIKSADLVTDMKKIKHPYDKGRKACKGLDY